MFALLATFSIKGLKKKCTKNYVKIEFLISFIQRNNL